MRETLDLILLMFAFVLFLLAAGNVSHSRVNLVALGLALYMASLIF